MFPTYFNLSTFERLVPQKITFSIQDFFSKCDQIRCKTATSVTFTEEISNGKLHLFAVGCAIPRYTIHDSKMHDSCINYQNYAK